MAEGANFIYAGNFGVNGALSKFDSSFNEIWTEDYHSANLREIAVSEDDFIYTGSDDATVNKVDSNGNLIWTFNNHTQQIYGLDIDNLGGIYSASFDGSVRKIDDNGNQVWVNTNHLSQVVTLIYDPLNHVVYSGGEDNTLRQYDADTGAQNWVYNSQDQVAQIVVDSNGNVIYADEDKFLVKVDSSGNFVAQSLSYSNSDLDISIYNDQIYVTTDTREVMVYDNSLNRINTYNDPLNRNIVRAINIDDAGFIYVMFFDLSNAELIKFDNNFNIVDTLSFPDGGWQTFDIGLLNLPPSSPIKLGETNIFDIYKGSTLVDRAYKGGTLFFGDPPPILYELIADVEVTSNTTQIDFDNLNITKDDELRLVYTGDGISSSTTILNLFANNETNQSNYYAQRLIGFGSSFLADRTQSSEFTRIRDDIESSGFVDIKISNNNRFVFQSQFNLYIGNGSADIQNRNSNVVGTFTISSINKLSIISEITGGIATGSRFTLYKINTGSA